MSEETTQGVNEKIQEIVDAFDQILESSSKDVQTSATQTEDGNDTTIEKELKESTVAPSPNESQPITSLTEDKNQQKDEDEIQTQENTTEKTQQKDDDEIQTQENTTEILENNQDKIALEIQDSSLINDIKDVLEVSKILDEPSPQEFKTKEDEDSAVTSHSVIDLPDDPDGTRVPPALETVVMVESKNDSKRSSSSGDNSLQDFPSKESVSKEDPNNEETKENESSKSGSSKEGSDTDSEPHFFDPLGVLKKKMSIASMGSENGDAKNDSVQSKVIPSHQNGQYPSKDSSIPPKEAKLERRDSTSSQASRGNWGSKWEFLLSCVGLSVGIGNIWRFPYLAYKNGGGAFLIPYLIMLVLAGKPMYFMELAFGQFAGVGPLAIWKCSPISKGVGVAMFICSLIVCIYYNVLMAYTVFYIVSSFQAEVPWNVCDPAWADMETCYVRGKTNITELAGNDTEANSTMSKTYFINSQGKNVTRQTASQQYWERYVLGLSSGIENVGTIKWDLALCNLLAWIVVVLCLIRGIKTSGKVVYFAATFPYVILITLLITGLFQEGAMSGILYFITPQFEKLLDIQVWREAAGQMFFSLSVSMGSLIMYSSYNPFRNNVYRDAMIVSVLDTFTSIIAGIVIFSVLGSMASDLNLPIDQVVSGGPGLAFVAYPEALTRLPIPQLWAVLFFLMLFILGLDSEFANFENLLTSLCDEFPFLRQHKSKFCVIGAIICYLLGLPCVTHGGQYVLQLMDYYGGGISLVFVAVSECIGLMWIYGLTSFCDDVQFMLGSRPSIYLRVTWVFCSPVILTFIFIYALVTHKNLRYGDTYDYPNWADGVGWFLSLISIIQIPIFAIYVVFKQPGAGLSAKIRSACRPDPDWGPADPKEKDAWRQWKERSQYGNGELKMTTISTISGNQGVDNPTFDSGP